MQCILCEAENETVLFRNDIYRIILVKDDYYPGYVQIIANQHKKELTDFSVISANAMFLAVYRVEKLLRELFNPDKINIASFGNMVPHLHWHIIPRFKNDRHFPNPVWGSVTNPDYVPSLVNQAQKIIIQNI